MEFRIGFDLSLIILSAVIFAANLKTLKKNRARLGRVQASWRLGFNFALPGSRLRAVLLLVPAAAGAVWLNSQPGSVKWLDALSPGNRSGKSASSKRRAAGTSSSG